LDTYGGTVYGNKYSYFGCTVAEVNVVGMNGLFNTVSNSANANTGNSIMANGDTAILADGSYKCSQGTCAGSDDMLWTEHLNGEVKCVEDNASCVLDGENQRRGMAVWGTGSATLILRALTFDKGYASWGGGGGVEICIGAIVDLKLLVFSNNRADSSDGGGAIYVMDSGTTVNIYGTTFNGNTADSGKGDDIFRQIFGSPTITIHNTCPSPYSSNTPIQGKTRMRIV
jgi:predicted outer membrane repeat protein